MGILLGNLFSPIGMAVTGALAQTYSTNRALIEQGKANQQTLHNYIKSMNYSFQNLEQERLDVFTATIDDLEKTRRQGTRMESMVNAAVEEGLSAGGRTAMLLKRSAAADTDRALTSIKDNYRKKMNEIDLNKESAALNANAGIAGIQDVAKPSLFGTLANVATAYYQGRSTQDSLHAIRNHAALTPTYKTYATDWTSIFPQRDAYRHTFERRNPYDNYRMNLPFLSPF